MDSSDNNIVYEEKPPEPAEYLRLRDSVGFSPRSLQAARRGLPGSLFALTARAEGKAVGMLRLVGDGGCSFLIVDVIVHPDLQRRGIGRQMLERLNFWMDDNVPPGGMVSLLADEPGRMLYEKLGFRYTAPESLGMKKHYPVD